MTLGGMGWPSARRVGSYDRALRRPASLGWDKGHEGPRDLRFCTSVADVPRRKCLAAAEVWVQSERTVTHAEEQSRGPGRGADREL